MNLPKISIVTPSLNQGKYLEETIVSVVSQNYPNLEYIIIDGGSNDESTNIIKKYSSYINYWVSEKDNGQSEAINKGLRKCTGDIATWLNSDDCYMDGALNQVAKYFMNGNFALLYGRSILFGEGMKENVKDTLDPKEAVLKCLSYVPFPQPSTFFKKQILLDQGYLDETLHYGMDHDLFVRIALNYDILGVDNIFSKYRFHESSKSNMFIKFAEERTKVFSKVLRSFPDSIEYITILKELGYYSEGTDQYIRSKQFTLSEYRAAFINFLEIQMHYYYFALDKKNVEAIAKFLLRYNDFQVNKRDARKIYLRIKFLNRSLISFFRKFTYN